MIRILTFPSVFYVLILSGLFQAVPLIYADESKTGIEQELEEENIGGGESDNCAQNVISSQADTCLAGDGDRAGVSTDIPGPVEEEPPRDVTILIQARVISVSGIENLLGQEVEVGDIITGEYVYSTSTMDSSPDDDTVGDYRHTAEPYGITLQIEDLVFQTDPNNVDFLVELVNRESDHYLLLSYNNLPLSNGVLVEHIAWQLDDFTGQALSSDSLKEAPTPPILSDWPESSFGLTIEGSRSEGFFIRAQVISAEEMEGPGILAN